MFSCLKQLVWGGSEDQAPLEINSLPSVQIDTASIGTDVVIVKQGKRICGTGGALACAPIAQDKAYFEIKVQCSGIWCVGLASKKYDLQKQLGSCSESWALSHDAALLSNGKSIEENNSNIDIEEGDVIGCTYDHVELRFYKNGKPLNLCIRGIKGKVFPAFYVDEGAILDTIFTGFKYTPPAGFDEIMIEQDIL